MLLVSMLLGVIPPSSDGLGSPFLRVPQPGGHELPLSLQASGLSLDPLGRALAGCAASLPAPGHLARRRSPLWELCGVRSVSVLPVGSRCPHSGLWSCRWCVFDLPSGRQCSLCVLRALSQGRFHSLHREARCDGLTRFSQLRPQETSLCGQQVDLPGGSRVPWF